MKRKRYLWGALLGCGLNGAVLADCSGLPQGQVVSLCVTSQRYSGPLSLDDLLNDRLERVRANGHQNLIYVRDQVQLAIAHEWGQWSLLARQSATLHASNGAVRVIADVETKGLPSGYSEQAALQMHGFGGWGGAWQSPKFQLHGPLYVQGGLQALQISRFLYRDLYGQVSFSEADGVYDLQARSAHYSDRLTFPYQRSSAPHGFALLGDLNINWDVDSQTQLSWGIKDWGRLWWRNLPQNDQVASSKTSAMGGDGYVVYKPLLQGRYQQGAFSERPWPTSHLSIQSNAWSDGGFALAVDRIWHTGVSLPSADVYQAWKGVIWRAGWRVREKTAVIGIDSKYVGLRWGVDQFGSDAHAHMGRIQIMWPLK